MIVGIGAFIMLTNKPMLTERERYECEGTVFEHYAVRHSVYDTDGSLESSSLWATVDGKKQEVEPKIISSNAQLNVIYSPWGVWTSLKRSLNTGAFVIYEKTTDTRKHLRASSGHSSMLLSDKDNNSWGYFDLVKDSIYVGLPDEGNNRRAFSGSCKRTY